MEHTPNRYTHTSGSTRDYRPLSGNYGQIINNTSTSAWLQTARGICHMANYTSQSNVQLCRVTLTCCGREHCTAL